MEQTGLSREAAEGSCQQERGRRMPAPPSLEQEERYRTVLPNVFPTQEDKVLRLCSQYPPLSTGKTHGRCSANVWVF